MLRENNLWNLLIIRYFLYLCIVKRMYFWQMNNRELKIPTGGMYQEWQHLMDLVEEDTAKSLEALASEKNWRIVQPDEAKECGFEELVDWSVPETDVLVLIDDNYLVCIPKKMMQS